MQQPPPQYTHTAPPQGNAAMIAPPQGNVVMTYPPQGNVIVTSPPGQTNYIVQHGGEGCCSGTSEKFNGGAGFVTGIIQLVLAVLIVFLSGLSYVFNAYDLVSYGIWGSLLFYVPPGILGIISKKKSTGIVTSYMILSIIASVVAFSQIIYESIIAHLLSCGNDCFPWHTATSGEIIHAFIAVLCSIEFIVAITAAAVCCGGLRSCCASSPISTTTTTTTTTVPVYYNHPAQSATVPMETKP